MVVDTSALTVVLFREPERDTFLTALTLSPSRFLSAVSFPEVSLVIAGRKGAALLSDFDALLAELNVEIVPFGIQKARLARDAFVRFGKGRHRAAPQFGDCASYTLAKARSLPLLYKGNDFRETDIPSAL
jgi:ribonuclease VapC